MILRRVVVENVWSFLDRAELALDGDVSILIGPNGGGKTNLLDAIIIMLRRYLMPAQYAKLAPSPDVADWHQFQANDQLNNMSLEKHSQGMARPQLIELDVKVTERDVRNMRLMNSNALSIEAAASVKYGNSGIKSAADWDLTGISAGQIFTYRLSQERLIHSGEAGAAIFQQYLQLFEIYSRLDDEFGDDDSLVTTPLLYIPANRPSIGFNPIVQLAGWNEFDQKRQGDAATSRTGNSIASLVQLAIGRLARRHRILESKRQLIKGDEFRDDPNLIELTEALYRLGYTWKLECTDVNNNRYEVRLTKQGLSFLARRASSGEQQLLAYLFIIYALNVRDALIVVDEPELHLHPKWQKMLLGLFVHLAESTGNQILLATHAAAFVSPTSIQYISRVFTHEQKSQIVRLDSELLPARKHLFQMVNSQKNERIFFADKVVLVEGILDRVFFEALLEHLGGVSISTSAVEVVDVGGKHNLTTYSDLLMACKIPYVVIADLDYVEQIGTEEIKRMFQFDDRKVRRAVVGDLRSKDGASLVASIEEALKTGSWDHARGIWDYIKSRHRRLRTDLDDGEKQALQQFLSDKRQEGMYILKKGSLEDYLPMGYKNKGLDRLVDLVTSQGFWDKLESDVQSELVEIVGSVVTIHHPEGQSGCSSKTTAACSLKYGQHSYVPGPSNQRFREDASAFDFDLTRPPTLI